MRKVNQRWKVDFMLNLLKVEQCVAYEKPEMGIRSDGLDLSHLCFA